MVVLVWVCTICSVYVGAFCIKRASWLCYASAFVAALIHLLAFMGYIRLPGSLGIWFVCCVQKGWVAWSLFYVVMLVGALPITSRCAGRLLPIRAELSIMACLLMVGHIGSSLIPWVRRVSGQMTVYDLASLVCALLITLMMTMLGVTSLACVKRRMRAGLWKQVQRLSYLWFGLVYLHIVFVLGKGAYLGGVPAALSLLGYLIACVIYVGLRLQKAWHDRVGELTKRLPMAIDAAHR